MIEKIYNNNLNKICPICESEQHSLHSKHLFKIRKCNNCYHENIVLEEKNVTKFVSKILVKNNIKQTTNCCLENVLEFSFCPYWEFVKNFNKIKSIKIYKKDTNILKIHQFSDKSIEIFSNNLEVKTTINNFGVYSTIFID
jgi:hypothetical protein